MIFAQLSSIFRVDCLDETRLGQGGTSS